MPLPADSLISHALEKMNARIAANPQSDTGKVRNGLLFLGNVHDAIPRRLLLDSRLSPLDKTGWMMIRLYAQNNDGAVFPTYDELQLQLASPGKGKASRETVSRVLLMLRITGWLSLCKRVRDDKGRVLGNIYAQHDEPVTFRDAEQLDPRFLDTVASACLSKNITISQTARKVLEEVKHDPDMRHYHTHLTLIEARLANPQMVVKQLSSVSEPGYKSRRNSQENPNSGTELSSPGTNHIPGSDSELPEKTMDYDRVRQPNYYVRNFTQGVNKNTYVAGKAELPIFLRELIPVEELPMLESQFHALPEEQAQLVLLSLQNAMARQKLSNPVGWMLAVMKKAREGQLYAPRNAGETAPAPRQESPPDQRLATPESHPVSLPASEQSIRSLVRDIRDRLKRSG
ncbi:STY4528 family pathogenicity island replication protein [Pantoea cypripedii]|uniref:STY4528 family pathogenicity island replication protein n=1 Tax=Pantoea cypripedii TaxID=55209 RepID=UPI002FC84839